MKKKNLSWQISKLRAEAGLEPSIPLAKVAVMKKHKKQTPSKDKASEAMAKAEKLQKEALQRKIHHMKKRLQQAAKKAKTFEVQKVVRKLKTLRSSGEGEKEIQNLEDRLTELKQARVEVLREYLFQQVCERMGLNEAGNSEEVSSKMSGGELLLRSAKLCTQGVKDVCADYQESVGKQSDRAVLNAQKKEGKKKIEQKESHHVNNFDEKSKTPRFLDGEPPSQSIFLSSLRAEIDSETDSEDQEEGEPFEEPFEEGDVDERDLMRPRYTDDSGAEFSEESSGGEDEDLGPKKKNRPGQKARQMKWQKEYGRTANHIQKKLLKKGIVLQDPRPRRQAGGKAEKDRGVFPPPKFQPRPQDQRPHLPGRVSGPGAGAASKARQPQQKQQEEHLHPSWEAKRKQKEQQANLASFAGKKITFDED